MLTTVSEVERGRRKIRQAQELHLAIVLELFVHRMISNKDAFDQSPYVLQQSNVSSPSHSLSYSNKLIDFRRAQKAAQNPQRNNENCC